MPFRVVILSLLAILPCSGSLLAQEAGKLAIRWHGQSFFEIRTSTRVRLVLDPHTLEQFGAKAIKADIILTSHFHTDHSGFQSVEGWQKVKRIDGLLDEKGDRRRTAWNTVDEKIKGVHIRSLGTYHDDMGGMRRGLNSVFILEVDGLRIVHLGDLGHLLSEAQLKSIGVVDILMVPVGGVYTLNGIEAKKVVDQLKPRRYILPMHYAVPRVYEDLLTAEEFLDEQKNVKKLPRNELLVDPMEKVPAEPTIVLLHWSDR